MIISQNNQEITVNTMSNWPLLVDLLVREGFSEEEIEKAKNDTSVVLKVNSEIAPELSAWGIPWKWS